MCDFLANFWMHGICMSWFLHFGDKVLTFVYYGLTTYDQWRVTEKEVDEGEEIQ